MSGLNKTLKKRENEVKSRVNTPHTSVNSNKLFKPLIASSLALALGVSVASATEPIINYKKNGTIDQTISSSNTALTGWSWNTGAGQSPYADFFQPVISNGTTPAELLVFKFDVDGTNFGLTSAGGVGSATADSVTQSVSRSQISIIADGRVQSGNDTVLKLSTTAQDKGLVLNNGNTSTDSSANSAFKAGSLVFDFAPSAGGDNDWNTASNISRKMELELLGKTSYEGSNVSLIGNIYVTAGRAKTYFGENKFSATFAGDVRGNINVTDLYNNQGAVTYNDLITTITFQNNAKLIGNLNLSSSGSANSNTIQFDRGGIEGNVTISNAATTISGLTSLQGNIIWKGGKESTITFASGNMVGDITRNSAIGDTATGDIVVNFNGGATLKGNIQTGTGNVASVGATNKGNDFSANKVTFSDALHETDVVLNGDIISYGTGNNGNIDTNNGNHVTFTNGSMEGNITADGRGLRIGYNKVTFSQAGAQLTGNITAKASNADSYRGFGNNEVIFENGGNYSGDIFAEGLSLDVIGNGSQGVNIFGTNTLEFKRGTSTIAGSIASGWHNGADGARGKNNITMSGDSNIISASITSTGGVNTIDISSTGISDISGKISVDYTGTNAITFSEGGTYSISGDILSRAGYNTIKFENSTSGSTSSQVVNGTIKGNITAENVGTNTISASGKLTLNSDTNSEKTYSASGGSTTITAQTLAVNNVTLSTTGGSNLIRATTLDTANFNSIQAVGGTNTIEATNGGNLSFTRGISSVSYGKNQRGNTITLANGDLTIGKFDSNVVETVYGDTTGKSIYAWNGNNSNTITLSKNEAILSLAGDITSGGGSTGNTINFNGTSGILKSSSGDSISASGTTNINVQALTIKNKSDNTGTLTTQGGTTTLTFKDNAAGSLNGNISTTGGSTNLVLKDNQSYGFTGTLSTSNEGKNNIDLSNKNATITTDLNLSGDNTVTANNGNIITIGASKTLTLNNSGAKTIKTSGGTTYINLNGTDANLAGNVETTSGNTKINFKDNNTSITGTLSVSRTGSTNIIVANAKTGTISGAVTAGGTSLVADIGDQSTLTLTGGITTSAGTTTINFNGATGTLSGNISTSADANTIFNLGSSASTSQDSGSVVATISGIITNANGNTSQNTHAGENFFSINAKTVTLKYGNNSSALAFTTGLNVISFENTSDGGATLNWQGSNNSDNKNIATSGGNTVIDFKNSGTIAGGVSTNGSNAITDINIFDNAKGTIEDAITLESNGINNVSFEGRNGVLILKDNATLTNVSNANSANQASNNGISFHHEGRSGTEFKTLNIGVKDATDKGISGDGLNFLVYAISNKPKDTPSTPAQPTTRADGVSTTTSYADKIVIHSSSNARTSTHHLGVVFEEGTQFSDIVYEKGGTNNILVATVADSSGVSFNQSEKTVLGFTTADVEYATESTNADGTTGSGYKSYYIGKVSNEEIIAAEQEITATAFTLNYDLYMANLNSLNKRMGELRENAHSHGVWARVFNGAQTNNQGLGSKSNYTTIQAGYDYAFGFEGANNYLGFALSYALSTSTSDKAFDAQGEKREIGNIYSNAVEVAVYNSYVSDMGWYNDTIAKFSYLMSNFDIDNLNTGSTTKNDTTNFAITLGDEVGYVFKLGESKEWSITPQAEFTFGYFNQGDFKQTLQNSGAYLASTADAVLTLRSRVGSSFGYNFKRFTENKPIQASVYVGAFYEYDYISGGGITMSTDQISGVKNALSDLKSDGRVVMNVGTNMTIKDNTRLYFDFEKSFAGNITTDYQVNVGVRYSFGESNGYTPMVEKTEFKAPLKVEGETEKDSNETQDQESVENTNSKSKSETATEQNTNSTENTTEEKAQ